MKTVVLLLPESGYRNDDFVAAARRLGLEVIVASDRCQRLAEQWDGPLAVRFREAEDAAERIANEVRERAPVAVLGVDDLTAHVAALAAQKLGLRGNAPDAVGAARNKALSRARLRDAGLPVPHFETFALDAEPRWTRFPCVVKPLALSGSRGVMRADDPGELRARLERLRALLRSPEIGARRDPASHALLVEDFIPGPEVALEGLLQNGALQVLALFDKPDPLDGPFFEETLYVTPSRHPQPLQDAVARAVQAGARALGLVEGPVHAELRLSPEGPRVLEIAARTIGGLCGRALRFGVGVSLEELVLRHAVGESVQAAREQAAAGVLMLPIRQRGVLEEVRGVEAARAVPGIVDVRITAHLDEELVPLPEGASYLGFAFARAATPEQVESALRAAGRHIDLKLRQRLPSFGDTYRN